MWLLCATIAAWILLASSSDSPHPTTFFLRNRDQPGLKSEAESTALWSIPVTRRVKLSLWSGVLAATLTLRTEVVAQTHPNGPVLPPPGFFLVDDVWVPTGDSVFSNTPWPNGVVPYAFDGGISGTQQSLFRKAMAEIEAISDVDFVPRTSQANYLYIQHNGQDNVSSSALGMIGGVQAINVGANHWTIKYILVHELFHTMGFLHEQQRPDRDLFVTILTGNISQTACGGGPCNHNFTKDTGATTVGPYDYLSMMHYGQNAFSDGTGPTIQCVNTAFQNQIGNRSYMTLLDAAGMAQRYGQPDAPSIASLTPSSVFAGSSDTWLYVSGLHFFEGSDLPQGISGSKVLINFQEIETIYIDETSVLGIIPAAMLTTPGTTLAVQVRNDIAAGGYSAPVNLPVVAPPCTTQGDQSGLSVAGLGDVNFDRNADYAVGAPGYNDQGAVFCYSGQTHQEVWQRLGQANEDFGKSLANIGDVNADGIDDLIIGAPGYLSNRGRAYVVSGANGTNILTLTGTITSEQYGFSVSGVGDVSGDSIPDVIIGAPYSGGGRIQVRSGASGALISTITETQAAATFGYSVAGGFDATGDGIPDFAVGTPGFDSAFLGEPSFTDRGRVTIYNGATGALVAARYGDGNYDLLGRSVVMTPSLTGSGNAFTIAGATEVGDLGGAFGGQGYVRAYRGFQTFNAYATWQTWNGATVGDQFGQSVCSAGDLNDDSLPDVAVGASQGGNGAFSSAVGPEAERAAEVLIRFLDFSSGSTRSTRAPT